MTQMETTTMSDISVSSSIAPSTFSYPLKRIGMIGGGQLGKMTAQAVRQMGFYLTILDPQADCSTAKLADAQLVGSLYDEEKIRQLAERSDVLTYEIEHIGTQTLKKLYDEGYPVYPSPYLLEIIQDKLLQKQALEKHGIPIPRYEAVDSINPAYLTYASYPFVQKARKGGYDGRGVAILRSAADAHKVLDVPSMVEEWIDFSKELAVMVARDSQGKVECYPVVEMAFDDENNICDVVIVPANLSDELTQRAQDIAVKAIEALEGVGVFGVEMFLTHDDRILVNEIAPRPHNSGHYTIEACVTSQFEQLVRILAQLPLGSAKLRCPAVMLNLLGAEGYTGQPVIEGLAEILAVEGTAFHFYDKNSTRPFRKMGHLTITAETKQLALEKLDAVKHLLQIKGQQHL